MTSILLVTSNGVGMGHLARQTAVALALPDSTGHVILTLSAAAPRVQLPGITVEYCPSHEQPWLGYPEWHDYLEQRVVALSREIGAKAVVFDGVAPYIGLIRARRRLEGSAFIWLRRGMWKAGNDRLQGRTAGFFHTIIEPGDIALSDTLAASHPPGVVGVPPISLAAGIAPLNRNQAAAELGVDPERPTALITLGGGSGSSVAVAQALRSLSSHSGWQVCLTGASHRALAPSAGSPPSARIVLPDIFPLSRYLTCFDLAISAAGYNAAHELLPAGVPTLFLPNASPKIDDQVTRAQLLADAGLALVAPEDNLSAISGAVAELVSPRTNESLRSTLSAANFEVDGANKVGQILCEKVVMHPWPMKRPLAIDYRAREALWALRNRLATSMRDTHHPKRRLVHTGREASETTNPILLTDTLGGVEIGPKYPVEHIVEGGSPEYKEQRLRIIDAFYR